MEAQIKNEFSDKVNIHNSIILFPFHKHEDTVTLAGAKSKCWWWWCVINMIIILGIVQHNNHVYYSNISIW
jgi:hypothetical protein